MITPKIKTLFHFIDFLHSNIDNFNQYENVINEIHLLETERKKLKPRNNFNDKLKSDEVIAEIKDKFNVIKENIVFPIRNKAIELDVCSFEKEPLYIWGELEKEIHLFKDNFSKDDLPEIFSQKGKYIEYRKETKGEAFFGLDFFFQDLDRLTKQLFDYFKISDYNEFEAFETKTIHVNDVSEAIEQIHKGAKKVSFPFASFEQKSVFEQNKKTLKEFISENKEQALNLNLSDYPAIDKVLQKQKDKLRDAELESEFAEVKDFAQKAVIELKHKIQLYLRNNVKPIYKNIVDPVLWDIRLLLEYKELSQTQPKQKKDKKYYLTTFWNEKVKTTLNYKSFKSQIDTNGFFQVKTDTDLVKIYTPELAVILTSTDLAAIDQDTQQETEINGKEYLKTYIEAYLLGEQYFDTEIKVSPNILYGANAEQYVKDIHLNYFHIQHKEGNEGWSYVKRNTPLTINHKLVSTYGYYSGIVNKVDEQVKKYPQLFETFDKCEHKQPPQQIQDEGLNEITEQNNLTISTIEDWLFEFKAQKILNETNYTVLVNALSHYFEKGVFPKLENEIKVGRVNKKLFGWNLNRIFYSEGKGVEIELLRFAKSNISIFKDVNFDENNIRKSNLYKYFTTKTK